MNRSLLLVVPLTICCLASAGCPDPTADKPKAEVKDAKPAAPKAETAQGDAKAEAGLQHFSNEGSKLLFVGSKVTGSHDGGFNTFKGTVKMSGGVPTAMALTIDMTSVFTDAAKLTGHLKGSDFFDIAKHPETKFASTAIKAAPANSKHTHDVTGNLTLRGATKEITFPIVVGAQGAKVSGEFSINRKDFGILYAGKADDLIRDNVLVKIDLAIK